MADAEDLKSSGDFSSCGFDSHPGHQLSLAVCSTLVDSPFSYCPVMFGLRRQIMAEIMAVLSFSPFNFLLFAELLRMASTG
jgi:hypothetical protein